MVPHRRRHRTPVQILKVSVLPAAGRASDVTDRWPFFLCAMASRASPDDETDRLAVRPASAIVHVRGCVVPLADEVDRTDLPEWSFSMGRDRDRDADLPAGNTFNLTRRDLLQRAGAVMGVAAFPPGMERAAA